MVVPVLLLISVVTALIIEVAPGVITDVVVVLVGSVVDSAKGAVNSTKR